MVNCSIVLIMSCLIIYRESYVTSNSVHKQQDFMGE